MDQVSWWWHSSRWGAGRDSERSGWRARWWWGSPEQPGADKPGHRERVDGKPLYYSYGCYACHGYNGETGARPFVGRWGNLGTEERFHCIPPRPCERSADYSINVHAEFRRRFSVR